MKKAIQYKLSHDTTYTVLNSNYISIMDGGGWCCENCGRLITNMVTIQDINTTKTYIVGSDCAETLNGIGKKEIENIKSSISISKKFYKKLNETNCSIAESNKGSYFLFKIVTKDFMNRNIERPFISLYFISIPKEKLAPKFKNQILNKTDILNIHPYLINDYNLNNTYFI
jgi:hypothetical protein